MIKRPLKSTLSLLIASIGVACATSPLGRQQLRLIPDSMMDQMGAQSFAQLKASTPQDRNPAWTRYVRCLVDPIIEHSGSELPVERWEVVVFQDQTANAFALPGGKVGVHTGILNVAKTNGQLAAVLGHEVGHVIARHGNERVSQNLGVSLGMTALQGVLSGGEGAEKRGLLLAALGIGVQVGVLLPFSREHETEADLIGADLMAKAGFDPRESTALWRNMMAANGKGGPEWLSTHPASERRIEKLEERLAVALPFFEQRKKQGPLPSCQRP